MIKTILFDIGGVLTFGDIHIICTNFAIRIGVSPELVRVNDRKNHTELILGHMGSEEFFETIRKELGKNDFDLPSIWLEEGLKITTVNTELFDFIKTLREKYTVGVLSNVTALRSMIDRELKIYNHFDFVLLSCKEHLKKPDAQFYQLACERSNTEPSEIFYMDDREKYIIAAREFGMQGMVYLDNQKVIEELGIL